ncbi:MAG TPA: 3-hydroxybutyryl-CoA dehydrogenase [Gemmatimonadaceae bacterium]|nr:3-hydroxybutyryl-CoA dehydrogenase [Gemmatimonadaceae bacterium]
MIITRVTVVGGGLMGSGIAQVCAQAGLATIVREVTPSLADRASASIKRSLDKGVEKGKVTPAARDAALGKLTFTTDIGAARDSDVVIEAIAEDLALKESLFRELDTLCPERTIFASNTSSLVIAEMAAMTKRPDRFCGLHFFNPVPLMPLVEVVRAVGTSDATVNSALALARALGKDPIVAKDRSGFVVNFLLVPYMLDAVNAFESGVASVEDIDKAMRLGCGHPMGPFTLLDFVGLDTTLKIAEIFFGEYREKRYAPPPLLKRMVTAGWYGRKSGKGFYDYSGAEPVVNAALASRGGRT